MMMPPHTTEQTQDWYHEHKDDYKYRIIFTNEMYDLEEFKALHFVMDWNASEGKNYNSLNRPTS